MERGKGQHQIRLRHFAAFLALFLLNSCAKTEYLWQQGLGQWQLHWQARPNQEVLEDPQISASTKEKIQDIQNWKRYFFDTLEVPAQQAYEKTTLLDRPTVSTLVIASRFDEIAPKKTCFPIVGCFPYLGFFDPQKAATYARQLEQGDYVTYVRPVYAYSTLGYFEDPILSSFFEYSREDLAELIFHELFHTVFFVENEVQFNENLASFFGHQMRLNYFQTDPKARQGEAKKRRGQQQLRLKLAEKIQEIKERFEDNALQQRQKASAELQRFVQNNLIPWARQTCQALAVKNCWPAEMDWNQASLAAQLTYSGQGKNFERLFNKKGRDIKKTFHYLQQQYKIYRNRENDEKKSFSAFLWEGL